MTRVRLRADTGPRTRRPWRPGLLTWSIVLLGLLGLGAVNYPAAAQWFSSLNQSKIVAAYGSEVEHVTPGPEEQLAQAKRYNAALSSGAVLAANARIPAGTGSSASPGPDYSAQLRANDAGLMARLRFPTIGADLPVYHGTSDATLLKGAGHLEGTSLPVGGSSTHSVITAHRGLADAVMFTHLDQAKKGDRFSIDVFGEVLSYRVIDVRTVEPDKTDTLRAVQGKDLVTLVTCTPLGINTHRILVTGERITPTPPAELQAAAQPSGLPGFPWWALWLACGVLVLGGFLLVAGWSDARARAGRPGRGKHGVRSARGQ